MLTERGHFRLPLCTVSMFLFCKHTIAFGSHTGDVEHWYAPGTATPGRLLVTASVA